MILKITSNVEGLFKSSAVPLYHSLVTSLIPQSKTRGIVFSLGTTLVSEFTVIVVEGDIPGITNTGCQCLPVCGGKGRWMSVETSR